MTHSRISAVSLSASLVFLIVAGSLALHGQQAADAAVVPTLVQFNGVLSSNGKPLTSITGVTFSLYAEQDGGAPLWMETQNVQPNANGQYTVMLGSTTSTGLPVGIFASGEAHWLGVQAQGQPEQPRVMLLSVPYALKAGDATTVGGLPASAFVLAAPPNASPQNPSSPAPASSPAGPNVGGSGTEDYLPLWIDNSGDLGNSILYQSGTTAVGINTTTPAATLDVNGGVISRGSLQLPSTGTATASQGYNSQPLEATASVFNSTTGTAVPENFYWQAEPLNNDQSTATGTLNLLFATGSNKAAETGLNIASTGLITFAKGQSFPGTGTITGVTAGTGLTGGGTSGNVTLSINVPFANKYYAQLAAPNTFTANQTVNANLTAQQLVSTVAQGTAPLQVTSTTQVPNLNASQLGGLSSSAFAQLGAASNTFTGSLTASSFSGNGSGLTNVTAANSNELGGLLPSAFAQLGAASNTFTGSLTASSFTGNGSGLTNVNAAQLGGLSSSAFAQLAAANTFTGNQTVNGNVTATATLSGGVVNAGTSLDLAGSPFAYGSISAGNVFLGFGAGNFTTTGIDNTASGESALGSDTTGTDNTASGVDALVSNTTGSYNTASGVDALSSNTTGTNNTATGQGALNANMTGGANTASGYDALNANMTGVANTASGYQALYSNTTGNNNTATGAFALQGIDTTASGNTATGYGAMYSATTGGSNLADGTYALYSNTTGTDNVAIGANALLNNTTGSSNVAIGVNAGTGANTNLNNTTAIGYYASVGISNAMVLGTTAAQNGAANILVGIDVSSPTNILTVLKGGGAAIADGWVAYSSRRWKTNIQTLPDALSKVEQLRGVSYDLKDSGKHEIGVIAEEVGAVVPEVVTYEDNGKDARGVDYSRLTALLIEATKQQQALIRKQQQQIRTQQAQMKVQQAQIAELNSQVNAIQASLKTNGRTGSEIRTVKAQVPMVQQ